jgi:hypothetical protein
MFANALSKLALSVDGTTLVELGRLGAISG